MSEFEPTEGEQSFQTPIRHTGRCVFATSAEPNTSSLFNPRAFTPIELKRIARQQVLRGREIHVLLQREAGVEEVIYDFRNADLSGRKPDICARETGELMEVSDGFFFVSPTE